MAPAAQQTQNQVTDGATAVATPTPTAAGSVSFSLSPLGMAKRVHDPDSRTVSRFIRARGGGVLSVWKGSTFIMFVVPPGSLDHNEYITMTVNGEGINTTIEFTPSGTTFNPPARLLLSFPSEGVNPQDIVSTLTDGSGSSTVDQSVAVRGRTLVILASIPHFSIYDPDLIDGEVIPPNDPDGDGIP